MGLLSLFVRKEPTTDQVSVQLGLKRKMDTVAYRDPEFTQFVGRWPWHQSGCPRKGQKTAMLNCYRWNLEWTVPQPAKKASVH